MPQMTVHQAKTHLSNLIERACQGEEVIIARGKVPGLDWFRSGRSKAAGSPAPCEGNSG